MECGFCKSERQAGPWGGTQAGPRNTRSAYCQGVFTILCHRNSDLGAEVQLQGSQAFLSPESPFLQLRASSPRPQSNQDAPFQQGLSFSLGLS